jgi:hypothetical protein
LPAWPFLAALLAACDKPVVALSVALSTSSPEASCEPDPALVLSAPQPGPLDGVAMLAVTVRGDEMSPLTASTPAPAAQGLELPNVPLGRNRRLTVEGRSAQGDLLSLADTGPFDLLDDGSAHTLRLRLRRTDGFSFARDPSGGCARLLSPRADLALTMLPDGRVLVSGGCTKVDQKTGACAGAFPLELEVFDPAQGTVSRLAEVGLPAGRARHSALTGPQPLGPNDALAVLFAGGENGTGLPVGSVAFLRGGRLETATVSGREVPETRRTRFASAVDSSGSGYALLLGGLSIPGTPSSATAALLLLDPRDGSSIPQTTRLPAPLWDAAAIPLSRNGLAVVGGLDAAGAATSTVLGLRWDTGGARYTIDPTGFGSLPEGAARVRPGAVRLSPAPLEALVVVGGLTIPSGENLGLNDYTFVSQVAAGLVLTANNQAPIARPLSAGGSAAEQGGRADGCAAALEGERSMLYTGGARMARGAALSQARADLIRATAQPDGNGVARLDLLPQATTYGLRVQRHRAACLRLRDGTVLVAGGLSYQPGQSGLVRDALSSLEIYTPAPGSY